MSNPTVSVVMPVYNGENYLRLSVESILSQTFQDFEIIVIDDGSKDSTPEVAQSFGDRVRYARQENAGVAAAVNHGIRLAQGRYFAWLSHDDLWVPEKLSKQLQALQQAGGPAVCYTDIKWIDGEGKVFDDPDLPKQLPLPDPRELVKTILLGGPVSFAAYSLMCELRCFEQAGPYDVKKRHTQDADMLMRLARLYPFVRVPEQLTLVRDHGTRDSYRPTFVAEANLFFRTWLDALTPAELYTNTSALGRGMSHKKIGDAFLNRGVPLWKEIAHEHYRKAVKESPLALPAVFGSLFVHHLRKRIGRYWSSQFYRIGIRSYLRRTLGRG